MEGVTWFTILVQVVNFTLLYQWVLKPLVFKPLQTAMAEREQKVRGSLDEAAKLNQEAQQLKEQYDARLKEAAVEANTMVANGQKEGERVKNELVEQGRKESQRLLEKANDEIKSQKEKAMGEIRGQVATLSVAMAKQLLSTSLDSSSQQQILERMLQQQGARNGA